MTTTTVFHMASSHRVAHEIVNALKASCFNEDNISALFPDGSRVPPSDPEPNVNAPESLTLGMAEGMTILSVPGLGTVLAAGPIRVALTSMAAGDAEASLLAALTSLGITQPQAAVIEAKFRMGKYLIAVAAASKELVGAAQEVFRREMVTQACEAEEDFERMLLP